MRLGIVPIRFLRSLGYEDAEETVKLSLPMSSILVGTSVETVGASIARPLLRLSRQSVTVSAQLKLLPMSVAHWLPLEGKLSPKVTDEVI